jgi:hypothetical protein
VNSENKTLIRESLAEAREALQEALPELINEQVREAIANYLVTGRARPPLAASHAHMSLVDWSAHNLLFIIARGEIKELGYYVDQLRVYFRPHTHISSRPSS